MFGFGKKKEKTEIKFLPEASYLYSNVGNAQYMDMSYKALAEEGYQQNAIAFRCIHMIKQAVASLEVNLYEKDSKGNKIELNNHPILNILNNPNPMQSGDDFIGELVAFFLISGNAFIYNASKSDNIKQIYNLKPDDVKVISDKLMPQSYEVDGLTPKRIDVDQVTGKSFICQIKDFNPLNPWYGQSRLQAAAHSIDTFNAAQKWNYNLLKNGAKPSGVINVKGDTPLTIEQYNELKENIERNWQGANNSNKPQILGNLEWKPMSLSPQDMDFMNNQIMSARYIANAFGVPSQLLNIPESQTFSNYEQANLSFWQDTAIPIANTIYAGLVRWLKHCYKGNYFLEVNEDKITALDPIRKDRAERLKGLVAGGILTINEARDAMDFEPIAGGDELYISGSQVPLSAIDDMNEPILETEMGKDNGENNI